MQKGSEPPNFFNCQRNNSFLNNNERYRQLSAQMEMPPQDMTIFSEEKTENDRLGTIEKRLDKLEGKTSGIIYIPTLLEVKQFS